MGKRKSPPPRTSPHVARCALRAPIAVPLEGVREGWGTSLAFAPPGALYLSWIEGLNAYRVGRWELARGTLVQGKCIGLLRAALCDAARDRLHLLTEHGLQELELGALCAVRTLRKGLPAHPVGLRATGRPNLALVGGFRAQSSLLVSLADYAVVARLAEPLPDVVLPTRDGFLFVADEEGVVFGLDGRVKRRFELPSSLAAWALDDGRVVVARAPENASGDGVDLAVFAPSGPDTRVQPLGYVRDEVTRFLGVDTHGYLVAETSAAKGAGLAWIELASGRVAGRIDTGRDRGALVLAGAWVAGTPIGRPTEPMPFFTLSADETPFAGLAETPANAAPAPAKPARGVARKKGPTNAGAVSATHAGVAAGAFVAQRFDSTGPGRGRIHAAPRGPVRFERCVFEHQVIAAPVAFRAATFVRCTFVMCAVLAGASGPSFTDIVIDGCAIKGKPCFLDGLDLVRVTFRGKNRGSLILQRFAPALLARAGGGDDYALDISDAEFSGLELRGLPSRLVRRNPELHGVVRRDKLADGRYRKIALGVARIILDDIRDGDAEDGLLLVNTLARDWRERAADLANLRRAGIAEPA